MISLLNIQFELLTNNSSITIIQCNQSEKISELLQRFLRTIDNNNNNLHLSNYSFKLNECDLSKNLTSTLSELNIENGSIIQVNPPRITGGEIGIEKNESKYLTFCDGLNLLGICDHPNCIAYKKEVIHKFGFGTYNVLDDIYTEKRPVCPFCEEMFISKTVGFMNCCYKLKGQKNENDIIQSVDWENETQGNIHYLKTDKKNITAWISLEITTTKIINKS